MIEQSDKFLSVTYNIEASSAVQSMTRPCLTFRNGYPPTWVDLSRNFEFGATYPHEARYEKGRYLTGVSVAMIASGLYQMHGWKWWLGSIPARGYVLPVPSRAEDMITGPLAYYATWHGKVPAPYGFAVWSHKIVSGAVIYVNAILEDE